MDATEDQAKSAELAAECGKLWPKMLAKGLQDEPPEGTMTELSEADTHTIKVDVMRTRGNHPAFSQPEIREQLRKMLTDVCLKEKIRYMQGLHEVAAVFAYIQSVAAFGDETSALNCFIAFVRIFMPCFYDGESFVILHVTLLFFRQLLLYHLPHLHNQLEEAGVAPVVYATPWFITLFAYKNPLHVTMRLWHEYIRRGDPTFAPFLAVALMELEKQAFLDAQEDDFNCAVDRTRITSLEKLKDVWKAAENLHARTPKSFTFRMSKVLTQVRQQLRKTGTGAPWTGSVLARAEQERRLALLAREAVAQQVRDGALGSSAAGETVPSSGLPSLKVLVLDVRPRTAFEAEHLPCVVHFHPICLQRFALLNAGMSQPRAERLAAALKRAVVDVGDLVLRKDSTPQNLGSAPDATALGAEVFQALQETASDAWGEGWLSESECAHLALLGGEDDWDAAQLCKTDAGGVVAALFELLTEQLSMPRVSVILGGAAVLHREAEKRGVKLCSKTAEFGAQDRIRGLLSGGADRASKAFASLRQKAKQAVDARDSK